MNGFRHKILYLALGAVALTACSGGSRDDSPVSPPSTSVTITSKAEVNTFLQFLNTQAALPAGDYSVVAATVAGGEADDFTLTITYDTGTIETVTGSWASSGGQDPMSASNVSHPISLATSGGLSIELTSSVDNYLYLVRNDQVIAQDDNSGGGSNAAILLANSQISSQQYAEAYYDRIDPYEERTSKADWMATNGFDNGPDIHVTFRDRLDLGYGRDMYARTRADGGIAIYIDNYVVTTGDGDVTAYGPLGLDAALAKDQRFLLSSNSIEFSPVDPDDPNSEQVIKMFTFDPPDANGNQPRSLTIDLDGRGEKYMPTACVACHGGDMYPLNPDGSFPEETLRSFKFNVMDPGHFTFSTQAGFTEDELQPLIRDINQLVHSTYETMSNRADTDKGKWSADFASDWGSGVYGGDFSSDQFDEDYVPEGWRQNANRPEGVERLFLEVVKPHCMACHQLRGRTAGEAITANFNNQSVALANAVNFSSYEKFISYNDRIIDLVYRRGQMPLSLLNYSVFWRYPDGPPTLLASFLDGFDAFDSTGNISEPQKPVASAGTDRLSTSPITLSGEGSFLTRDYSWEIVSAPSGATASLSSLNSMQTTLTADTNGDYVVRLTTSNESGLSDSDEVTVTIDSFLSPRPEELNFVNDIQPLLVSCTGCHSDTGIIDGIPAYFNASYDGVYQEVKTRVNFVKPEDSPLLMKPTQIQHGGGVLINRSNEAGELTYQTLLNWIVNGAPCGDDPQVCGP